MGCVSGDSATTPASWPTPRRRSGPCPVCGSCEHPAPASRGDDPITDKRIAEAEAARKAAMTTDREASAVLRAAEQSLADAVARAAGKDIAEAEAEPSGV